MPDDIYDFLTNLPVRKIPGVGKVAERKLLANGIQTVGQLRDESEVRLVKLFGKSGSWFHKLSNGIDEREVIINRERKSIGAERTFIEDIKNIDILKEKLYEISEELIKRLQNNNLYGRTLSLKVTYSDFTKISKSSSSVNTINQKDIYKIALNLLTSLNLEKNSIRLLGLSIKNLEKSSYVKKYNDALPLIFN